MPQNEADRKSPALFFLYAHYKFRLFPRNSVLGVLGGTSGVCYVKSTPCGGMDAMHLVVPKATEFSRLPALHFLQARERGSAGGRTVLA